MRKNVVLCAYNRAIYIDQTQAIEVKLCSQKFHLHVPFITCLDTFACVWAHVQAITCLSWKGLNIHILQIMCVMRLRH